MLNRTANDMTMTPKEVVDELNKYIIGQEAAKKAVACAMRNRWRRMQLDEILRKEIMPKNILMIGATGVGKTEIARRLAGLSGSPFIKVEATKFTEVGYVGRDVESIIRDLIDVAVKGAREKAMLKVRSRGEDAAIERVIEAIIKTQESSEGSKTSSESESTPDSDLTALPQAAEEEIDMSTEEKKTEKSDEYSAVKSELRKQLLAGELDDQEIQVELFSHRIGVEIMGPPGMEEMTSQLQHMFQSLSNDRRRSQKMKVKDALKYLREEESAKLVNEDEIVEVAITQVEQNGIVFLDELDKLVRRGEYGGGDVSQEGVQRDLLPLVEGSTVFTKYGMIRTDHILFIAAGAFHLVKPSDLIPEMQGRFPIRVELDDLTAEDFVCILTEPSFSLTKQYAALMQTEGVTLNFSKDGIKKIAEIAYQVNENTENIGARRLYTVMERLLESIAFEAPDRANESILIDKAYVKKRLDELLEDEDLSRYIL